MAERRKRAKNRTKMYCCFSFPCKGKAFFPLHQKVDRLFSPKKDYRRVLYAKMFLNIFSLFV
jgi:hypothetical protein